jgi:hypothetical protein
MGSPKVYWISFIVWVVEITVAKHGCLIFIFMSAVSEIGGLPSAYAIVNVISWSPTRLRSFVSNMSKYEGTSLPVTV